MNFPQDKMPELVRQACALKGVRVCTPNDLLMASIFGVTPEVKAYRAVCAEVDAELISAGFTHLEWENGELTEI